MSPWTRITIFQQSRAPLLLRPPQVQTQSLWISTVCKISFWPIPPFCWFWFKNEVKIFVKATPFLGSCRNITQKQATHDLSPKNWSYNLRHAFVDIRTKLNTSCLCHSTWLSIECRWRYQCMFLNIAYGIFGAWIHFLCLCCCISVDTCSDRWCRWLGWLNQKTMSA